MKDFNTFKAEILRRAKIADACVKEYTRALRSETFAELMQAIKDNFWWCCIFNIVDEEIINKYKSEFNSHDIFCNESRDSGYLLVTGNVDRISGDCEAVIKGDAFVNNICGNAIIDKVYDNAIIDNVCDNARIDNVCDNARIGNVSGNARIYKVYDNARIYKVYGNAIIDCVYDNAIIINDCR